MRKPTVIFALICLLALSCAAHAGYPMKARDVRGKVITLKSKPMRIVSIAPSNSETLFALGLEERIVGVTRHCNYPPAAAKKPKIGDMNVSVEAVVALKPDLVLAHAHMNDTVIPRLEKLGLTVYAVDPKTINHVIRDIRAIGRITAQPKTAEKVASKMEQTIRQVRKSRAGKPKKDVLIVIQSSPIWVAGPKTFVDEMLGIANAGNVAYDARPGFVTFSKELAISRSPDVIITGLKSDAEFFLKSPLWKNANAVKNKRVYVLNNDLLVRPGPRLTIGLEKLAEKLSQ